MKATNNQDCKGTIHMKTLYTKNGMIGKLWEHISPIFSDAVQPTQKHLFDLMLSVLALNGFQSVKFCFEHFIQNLSTYQLKSYYYTLSKSRISLESWMKQLLRKGLSIVPSELRKQAVVLSIDDTMAEKSGEKFEYCSKLFDHAAHNGSNYLNGHCFVSLLLSVLTSDHSYLSIPVACRMWTKVKSKLEMAAELVRDAMSVFDPEQPVILCCDSWYPKGEILELVQEFQNLTLICNVRSDTVLYDLPPERTVKRGRPRIWGKRLSLQDFELKAIPGTNYLAGSRPVMTRLFGHRVVYAIVTKTKKGSSYRVFLCTSDPASISFNPDFVENSTAAAYAKADPSLLPLTIYSLRWKIEVSYYEQKTFWGFEDYMLRSHNGIERLLNLLGILYALMKLLPFLSEDFSALKSTSAQQTRFVLGSRVRQQVFLSTFASRIELDYIPVSLKSSLYKLLFEQLDVA